MEMEEMGMKCVLFSCASVRMCVEEIEGMEEKCWSLDWLDTWRVKIERWRWSAWLARGLCGENYGEWTTWSQEANIILFLLFYLKENNNKFSLSFFLNGRGIFKSMY